MPLAAPGPPGSAKLRKRSSSARVTRLGWLEAGSSVVIGSAPVHQGWGAHPEAIVGAEIRCVIAMTFDASHETIMRRLASEVIVRVRE
jgi:hypothetical protein